jgi:ketosteroid isomerase-like protein
VSHEGPDVADALEVVRSIYDGWSQGDFTRSDWARPEIEFVYVGGPEPARWKGVAGMDQAWQEWLRDWVDFRAEPIEYVVVDPSRILVLVRNRGQGKLSGLDLEQQSVGNLFEFAEGGVARLVVYLDITRAFADLGLER